MAKRPRTQYVEEENRWLARVTGFGKFYVNKGDCTVINRWNRTTEEVADLDRPPQGFDDFKELFDAWWSSIAPWQNIAFDIVIYDRFGRGMGTATEHRPLVARRRARELATKVNGTRAIVLRRNKTTLEVKQVYGFKRRPRRAVATTT